MRYVLESVCQLIERFVLASTTLSSAAVAGQSPLEIPCTRRWLPADKGWLGTAAEGEVVTVSEATSTTVLSLESPLLADYPEGTPLVKYPSPVEVLRFNPPVLSRFPAITVEAASRDGQPLTLGTTEQTFSVVIGVWTEANDEEAAYQQMLDLVRRVEVCLWRNFQIPMSPRIETVLTQPLLADDLVAQVDDATDLLGEVWIESCAATLPVNVCTHLGGGVLELAFAPGSDFPSGASVWRPCRQCFASEFTTSYGTAEQRGGSQLHFGRIDLDCRVCQIHEPRLVDGVLS